MTASRSHKTSSVLYSGDRLKRHRPWKGDHPQIWIAGMVLDKDDIQSNVSETLVELNCRHNVGIHILLNLEYQVIALQQEWRLKQEQYHHRMVHLDGRTYYKSVDKMHQEFKCGPFLVQDQNSLNVNAMNVHHGLGRHSGISSGNLLFQNRIDKISALRDLQRSILLNLFVHPSGTKPKILENDVVIIVDLDLHEISNANLIMSQVKLLQDKQYPYDAICAAGITMNIGGGRWKNETSQVTHVQEPWYYDTFATVFLPDTFSHPTKRRLIPYMYQGEDPKLIRSNHQYGNFTQGDIYRYLLTSHQGEPTSVKSCFGGMAIYRAVAYFDRRCHYHLDESTGVLKNLLDSSSDKHPPLDYFQRGLHHDDILRYANNKEKRPCEHVVFHDCLKRVQGGNFQIAVNPLLTTFWKRDS